MPARPTWNRVKIHRSYTVDEAARTLGVCKATVRRWIKAKGLPLIDQHRPALILGPELIAFGKSHKAPKQKCELDQAYCLSCRAPKNAALGQMEIIQANAKTANVRMQCETCMSLMHKRFAWRDLSQVSARARVSASQAHLHLIETNAPCLSVHFKKDE
jgi:transposase-like protein